MELRGQRNVGQVGQWSTWVVGSALVLVGLSVVHALSGSPSPFGLSTLQSALVLGTGLLIHVMMILLAAGEQKEGFIGNLICGALWLIAAAASLISTPDLFALILEVGVLVSALVLIATSFIAWRSVEGRHLINA